ncbi:hypothetical protein JCM10207_001540 [Rhodosporidiobolus poonsookiae]
MDRLVLPPLQTSLDPPPSAASLSYLSEAWLLTTWIALVLLLWDWGAHFPEERRYLYLTIAQSACMSVVSFFAHLVLTFRMFSVFCGSLAVFYSLLVMSIVDLGLQLAADVLVQPVFFSYTLVSETSTAPLHLCYLTRTTPAFSIAFLSPTLFGHTVLALTLFASWKHWSTERALAASGVKRPSLMTSLRMEHAGYILAICLTNFANVVLVLQDAVPAYQLIHYLPALVLSHLFLTRMWFSLEKRLDLDNGRREVRLSIPPIEITSPTTMQSATPQRLSSPRSKRFTINHTRPPPPIPDTLAPPSGELIPTLREHRLQSSRGISPATLEIRVSTATPSTHHVEGQPEELLLFPSVAHDLPPETTSTLRSPHGTAPDSDGDPTSPTSVMPLFHLPTREIVRQASLSGSAGQPSPVSPSGPSFSFASGPRSPPPSRPSAPTPGPRWATTTPPNSAPALLDFPSLPSPGLLFVPAPMTAPSPADASTGSGSLSSPEHRSGYEGGESASPSPSRSASPALSSPSEPSAEQGSSSSFSMSGSGSGSHSHSCSRSFSSGGGHGSSGNSALPPLPPVPFYQQPSGRPTALSVVSASQVEGYLSRGASLRRGGGLSKAGGEDAGEVADEAAGLTQTGGGETAYESAIDPVLQGRKTRRSAKA